MYAICMGQYQRRFLRPDMLAPAEQHLASLGIKRSTPPTSSVTPTSRRRAGRVALPPGSDDNDDDPPTFPPSPTPGADMYGLRYVGLPRLNSGANDSV